MAISATVLLITQAQWSMCHKCTLVFTGSVLSLSILKLFFSYNHCLNCTVPAVYVEALGH